VQRHEVTRVLIPGAMSKYVDDCQGRNIHVNLLLNVIFLHLSRMLHANEAYSLKSFRFMSPHVTINVRS
jgi:hypothetical protein